MNTQLLQQMAINEAWKAMQDAYGTLYVRTDDEELTEKDKAYAESQLKKANEWLTALRS